MSIPLSSLWTTAAWREAARLRAAEVDVDHLYLGLIAVGGAAAQLLGTHGITLASARRQVRAAHPADPGALGVDVADLPSPIHFMQAGDAAWRATARADEVVKGAGMTDTYELLVALLKEPSGTVRRLVAADGVTPQGLVPALKAGADDPYTTERAVPDTTLLPGPARAQRVRRYVSAPVGLVADALADPTLLQLWSYDPTKADVSGGGCTVRHHKGGDSLTVRLTVTTAAEGDRRVVTWVQEALDGRYAGERLTYDRFEVSPAAGGATIVRTAGRRTFGLLGRAASPFTDRFIGWGMLHTMQAITFGIADRQPS